MGKRCFSFAHHVFLHTLKALNDIFQFFLGTVCGKKENFIVKGEYQKDGTKFKVSWQTYLKGRGHGDYCHNRVKIARQHFNLLANINGPVALRRRRRYFISERTLRSRVITRT